MNPSNPLSRRPAAAVRPLLVALATVTCAAGPTEPAAPPPERVLFIGNSLTYEHDLPRMVQALSLAAGHEVAVAMIAQPNFALEDHWGRPEVHGTIADGDWDVVVLQQGPSALASSREDLRRWTRRFARPIRDAGAVPALYMVWPAAARFDDFPRVSESYRLAARDVDGILLPAGDAWLEAWKRDAGLQLYGPDAFHPSEAGTYLAALTIVGALFRHELVGLPATLELTGGGTVAIPPATAAILQAAAAAVVGTATSSRPDRDR
jgi:hypothetical protein